MARVDRKFTLVAGRAADLADLFNGYFHEGLPGPVTYRIEMTEPAGPSTEGGKQALQHIRLLPTDGGPAIVVGSVNQAMMTANLRTMRHLAQLHAERFKGTALPIEPEAYHDFVGRAQAFLVAQGYQAIMLDMAQSITPPPAKGSSAAWWVVVLVLLLVIAATAWFILRPS